jgi:6-phosphogluconolactonase
MASAAYLKTLRAVCGKPVVLDVVQLGLGDDGHTASLVPGDPICNVTAADIGLTEIYKGRRRMTMTYPVINRARHRLWLTAATKKESAIALLLERSPSIPAGIVSQESATLLTTIT